MTDPTPPLTEAEEQALDEYEDAVVVRVDQPHTALIKDRVQSSRAAAVAAIRAAERERVLRAMIERIDQKVEPRTCLRDDCWCDECGLVHDLRLDLSVSIEKLRGEGAR